MRVPFTVLRGLTRLPDRRTLRPRDPSAASLLACSKFKHQQLLQPGCLFVNKTLVGTESGWPGRTACWPQVQPGSWQVLIGVGCGHVKADSTFQTGR